MNSNDEFYKKGFQNGYIKGYLTGLEFVQRYCEDMIRDKQKEFEKK